MTNKISNKTRQDLTIKYLIENICFTFIKYNCFWTPSLTQILFIIQAKLAVMIPNDLKVYPFISWMFCSFGDFSIFTPNFVLIFKHYTQLFSLCITMVTYNTESIKKQKKRADINAIYITSVKLKSKISPISKQTQLAFTCSKLTIETLEQSVKSVQSLQKRHQNEASICIVNSEHVTAGWGIVD